MTSPTPSFRFLICLTCLAVAAMPLLSRLHAQDTEVRKPEIVGEPNNSTGNADAQTPAADRDDSTQTAEEEEPAPEKEPEPPKPPKREPGDDLFEYAMVLYNQKYYDLAVDKFRTYLTSYKSGRHKEESLYRSAECYLQLSMREEALSIYKNVLQNFGRGKFASPSAYRIASLAYNNQRYGYAAPYFRIAASKAEVHKVKVASLYYRARCLQLDSQTNAARTAYKEVVAIEQKNSHWHKAVLALGRMAAEAGDNAQALEWFSKLADQANIEELVGATINGSRNPRWRQSEQRDLIEALG